MEPLSGTFLAHPRLCVPPPPPAPSNLDSSLHVDLGISEPAHVVRRLGESWPADKGACRKIRSEGEVGWGLSLASFRAPDAQASLSPPVFWMPILYRSSPDPRSLHPVFSSSPLPPGARIGGPQWASPSCGRASSKAEGCEGPRGGSSVAP